MTGIRKKQIIVTVLVIMIIAAGYLQYSYKKSSISNAEKETKKLGEAVYVDNEDAQAYEESEDKNAIEINEIEEVTASNEANGFFAQAKLDREVLLSKNTEVLKDITEDPNAEKEVKNEAYDRMMQLLEDSHREQKIETLVKERGFNDCLAVFGDDGSLDIIVKTASLSLAQTAQIADIAVRHANLEMQEIHIKNMY